MSGTEAELARYRLQLAQVDALLVADPANEEVKKLRADLAQVVELTEGVLEIEKAEAAASAAAAAAAAASASKAGSDAAAADEVLEWKLNDECEAPYKDGKYYPAYVVEVSKDQKFATVKFAKYGDTEIVKTTLLRRPNLKRKAAEEAERQKKIQRRAEERRAAEEKAHIEKRSSWVNFAQKKGKTIPGLRNKSIFASPDSLDGRVGVVNSGRSATPLAQRKKHEFNADGTEKTD